MFPAKHATACPTNRTAANIMIQSKVYRIIVFLSNLTNDMPWGQEVFAFRQILFLPLKESGVLLKVSDKNIAGKQNWIFGLVSLTSGAFVISIIWQKMDVEFECFRAAVCTATAVVLTIR